VLHHPLNSASDANKRGKDERNYLGCAETKEANNAKSRVLAILFISGDPIVCQMATKFGQSDAMSRHLSISYQIDLWLLIEGHCGVVYCGFAL
jgi:hypothetical protein